MPTEVLVRSSAGKSERKSSQLTYAFSRESLYVLLRSLLNAFSTSANKRTGGICFTWETWMALSTCWLLPLSSLSGVNPNWSEWMRFKIYGSSLVERIFVKIFKFTLSREITELEWRKERTLLYAHKAGTLPSFLLNLLWFLQSLGIPKAWIYCCAGNCLVFCEGEWSPKL